MDGAADVVNKAYAMAQQQNARALLDAQPVSKSFLTRVTDTLKDVTSTETGWAGVGLGLGVGLLLWRRKGR